MQIPMNVKRQLNDKLDWILAVEELDERVERLSLLIEQDNTLIPILRMGVFPERAIVGLPEGEPPIEYETGAPDGMGATTIRQEYRRIQNFSAEGSYINLKKAKREEVWGQILESLHWKEAKVLTHIKDQTLLEAYPGLQEVFEKKFNISLEGLTNRPKSGINKGKAKTKTKEKDMNAQNNAPAKAPAPE